MSSTTPSNTLITSCLTVALVGYSGYHAWKFDKGRCLLWQKGHHIRWAMVWAQLLTAACYAIWAMGLTHLKWSIGYIQLPVFGIIPVPWQLWTSYQTWLNNIYCAFLCTAFCLYDAVNLEEWLYWVYVVRAVRAKSRQQRASSGQDIQTSFTPTFPQKRRHRFLFFARSKPLPPVTSSFTPEPEEPKRSHLDIGSASGLDYKNSRGGRRAARKTVKWIMSNVFLVWAVLSVAQTVVHFTMAFVGNPNVEVQTIRLFLTEGFFNAATAFLSIILSWEFPSFIKLVKDTGASREVISKLQFYHELNKWRIFFRVIFAAGTIMLGSDATTKAKKINLNSLASGKQAMYNVVNRLLCPVAPLDLIFQTVVLSFFFASVCSWMLYLPVQWNKFTPTRGYIARHGLPLRHHGVQGGRGVSHMPAAHAAHSPASAAAAAKALGSPTIYASASMHGMASPSPFSDSARRDEQEENRRRMLMSKHSEQHHTLIDLLRERGTIGRHERVPEDDIFDDEADAEAFGRSYGAGSQLGHYAQGLSRKYEDEGTFATALAEPGSENHSGREASGHTMPAGMEPAYGTREMGERVPGSSVPHVLQNFESPAAGFARHSVPPKNVVINVSRDVEIDRDEGEGSVSRMV